MTLAQEPYVAPLIVPAHLALPPAVVPITTIPITCETRGHSTPGFANLRIARRTGPHGPRLIFDPHVDGGCVLSFDENAARAAWTTLGEWLA